MNADQTAIQQIHAIEALRVKALVNADIATLDRITAENYIHVESSGRRRTKREFLDGFAHAEYRFESFVIDENQIQVFGATALVTGCYHNDIRTPDGLQPAKYARHIRVYVKNEDEWRNVAHQATEFDGMW